MQSKHELCILRTHHKSNQRRSESLQRTLAAKGAAERLSSGTITSEMSPWSQYA